MTDLPPVLALDGPSGSGKGTIGQRCALELGWHYLDSGAVYRALGWCVDQAGIDLKDIDQIVKLATHLDIQCHPKPSGTATILINGEVAAESLRSEESGAIASKIATIPEVRTALLTLQKGFLRPAGLVADGRDMGTVVFPRSRCKVFLTASVEQRAKRRAKQLKQKGLDVNLARLFQAIQARDARDSQRRHSPLTPAEDAILLDTSTMTIDQVVAHVLDQVKQRLFVRDEEKA